MSFKGGQDLRQTADVLPQPAVHVLAALARQNKRLELGMTYTFREREREREPYLLNPIASSINAAGLDLARSGLGFVGFRVPALGVEEVSQSAGTTVSSRPSRLASPASGSPRTAQAPRTPRQRRF